MSDEFEGAAGSVDSEVTGAGSGEISESSSDTEQSAGSGQPQVTMDLLQEALSGVSGQWSEQFSGLSRAQQQLAAKLEKFLEGQTKQQEKPVLPDDPNEFKLNDTNDLHKVLKLLDKKNEERLNKIEKFFEQEKMTRQEQQLADQYYGYLDGQTRATIEKIPMFKDPDMSKLLKQQVAAHVYSNGGDLNKVNIMNIAQGLAKQIQTVAENISKGNRSSKQNVFPLKKGAPAKPGQKQREFKTSREIDDAIDEFLGSNSFGGD